MCIKYIIGSYSEFSIRILLDYRLWHFSSIIILNIVCIISIFLYMARAYVLSPVILNIQSFVNELALIVSMLSGFKLPKYPVALLIATNIVSMYIARVFRYVVKVRGTDIVPYVLLVNVLVKLLLMTIAVGVPILLYVVIVLLFTLLIAVSCSEKGFKFLEYTIIGDVGSRIRSKSACRRYFWRKFLWYNTVNVFLASSIVLIDHIMLETPLHYSLALGLSIALLLGVNIYLLLSLSYSVCVNGGYMFRECFK